MGVLLGLHILCSLSPIKVNVMQTSRFPLFCFFLSFLQTLSAFVPTTDSLVTQVAWTSFLQLRLRRLWTGATRSYAPIVGGLIRSTEEHVAFSNVMEHMEGRIGSGCCRPRWYCCARPPLEQLMMHEAGVMA